MAETRVCDEYYGKESRVSVGEKGGKYWATKDGGTE